VSASRRVGGSAYGRRAPARYAHTPMRSISLFKLLQDVQRLDQVSAH
jgi:hypothetical protein